MSSSCLLKLLYFGFGTVGGVPFLLKENGEKIVQAAHSEIEVAKSWSRMI